MSLKNRVLPDYRRALLKKLINENGFVRVLEAHNGLSALIANDTKVETEEGVKEFDALWESSLTDTASKGLPDAEIVGYESRYENIRQILSVTNKPLIVDGDTGKDANTFEYVVSDLERMGVSAVIIEDKVFPKRNSLEDGTNQTLEDANTFAQKIERGKAVSISSDFMIIARIEALIAGLGLEEALTRAKKYLKAGVDGVMIHSKSRTPDEISEFCLGYDKICEELGYRKPLVVVPTTYNTIKDSELKAKGVNVVIHANHLLRSAYKAMSAAAEKILTNDRSLETDAICATTKEIFKHVGFLDIKKKDVEYTVPSYNVIIPAAGKEDGFDVPKAALKINGKTILERQYDLLKSLGLSDVTVIRGYKGEKINLENVSFVENPTYDKTGIVESLFLAENKMEKGFISLHSDIICSNEIMQSLLNAKGDIVLVVDNSYSYHKHEVDKKLDLVISRNRSNDIKIKDFSVNHGEVVRIGKQVNKDDADYEFTGIAKFSEKGAEMLMKVYADLKSNHTGSFHEAESFNKASFTDIIQELISRDIKVEFINTYKGWIEIHDSKDLSVAEGLVK